jgi:hypothetical protein
MSHAPKQEFVKDNCNYSALTPKEQLSLKEFMRENDDLLKTLAKL